MRVCFFHERIWEIKITYKDGLEEPSFLPPVRSFLKVSQLLRGWPGLLWAQTVIQLRHVPMGVLCPPPLSGLFSVFWLHIQPGHHNYCPRDPPSGHNRVSGVSCPGLRGTFPVNPTASPPRRANLVDNQTFCSSLHSASRKPPAHSSA